MTDEGYDGDWRVMRHGDEVIRTRYRFWPIPMRRLAKAWDLYLEPEADHPWGMGVFSWMRYRRLLKTEVRE